MSKGNRKLSRPDRKISETFLLFASTILPDPTPAIPLQRVEEALRVAHTVWNTVIFADVHGDRSHLHQIRAATAGKPELVVIMEHLITRKREHFADDERLIGLWEVTETKDGFNVRAEARDPRSLPRSRE